MEKLVPVDLREARGDIIIPGTELMVREEALCGGSSWTRSLKQPAFIHYGCVVCLLGFVRCKTSRPLKYREARVMGEEGVRRQERDRRRQTQTDRSVCESGRKVDGKATLRV